MIFMSTKLTHWPAAEGFWGDHFIMKTQTGLYFRLNDADKFKGMGDASLV